MALVTTKEMFAKAYAGKYAVGAFNINNMEIIQAITEAAAEEKSPVILQVSAGARKYAKHISRIIFNDMSFFKFNIVFFQPFFSFATS